MTGDRDRIALAAFVANAVLAGGNAVGIRSTWLDDEPVDGPLALGGLLVLAGVYIGALRPARTPPTRRGVQVPAGGADARRANGLHHTVADRTASEPMDR
jgi:hypothetical protein